jgi:hypothetical protein
MGAGVEWVVGIIRSGPKFEKHGDPYNFVCTLMKENEKGFLMAASGTFTKETYKAVAELVKSLGLEEVRWEKKNIAPRKKKKTFYEVHGEK